jgi:Flp pilus assembly protein TadG
MNILSQIKILFADKKGNVAMLFGLLMFPLMLSAGAAIDYTIAATIRSNVASATDAAIFAASSAAMQEVDMNDVTAVEEKLNEVFEPFFLANMESSSRYTYNGYTLSYDPLEKRVTADVDVTYNTAVFRIVGNNTWEAGVLSSAKMQMRAGGAVSMFLVLDRSGSMGWSNGDGGTKMASLQTAVVSMIDNLKAADPNQKFIRMGAVAYNSSMWTPQGIRWNLTKAKEYVLAMSAGGGTDSSDAVNKAYSKLKKPIELTEHDDRSGQDPKLVMLFMTDGNNNSSSDDVSTINTCNLAKAYGMEIYTVAFQAPSNGERLLSDCASDDDHYFNADSTDELVDAFVDIGADVAEFLILSQ